MSTTITQKKKCALAADGLRCGKQQSPIGVNSEHFLLSWKLAGTGSSAYQSAYQIEVEKQTQPNDAYELVCDTGKVESGLPRWNPSDSRWIEDERLYRWRIRAWDVNDTASAWSDYATFRLGLNEQESWLAQWTMATEPSDEKCAYMRKTFTLAKEPIAARVYYSARGLAEVQLNGSGVTQDVLTPGWSDYRKRCQSVGFDVGDRLKKGSNAIGVILAEGWYAGRLGWKGQKALYGDTPELILQLHIDFEDGTSTIIGTDSSWEYSYDGAIQTSSLYDGECVDLNRECNDWTTSNEGEWNWSPVKSQDHDVSRIISPKICQNPFREMEIAPVKKQILQDGRIILDFGQNLVGWPRLSLKTAGSDKIRLRFAEMLDSNGELYLENLRSAEATDWVTPRPGQPLTWEPSFTFHGFRYVEVSGIDSENEDFIQAVVIRTEMESTGRFTCSDEDLNQLYSSIVWGQRGNFLEVPTDCPQRDERLGWTGDIQVFQSTASFNMDIERFLEKWLVDVNDGIRSNGSYPVVAPDILDYNGVAGWSDAAVICPWGLYQRYGNRTILSHHYENMCRWIEYQETTSIDLIRPAEGFGDWLATDAVEPRHGPTPRDLVATAYFAKTTELMVCIAETLEKPEDAAHFRDLLGRIKQAFLYEFMAPSGRLVGHTQSAYLLALDFGLIPQELIQRSFKILVHLIESRGNCLTTGFLGTPLICRVLSRYGRHDLAYKLLFKDTYPSWLYPIRQGATTMWERWNSYSHENGFGNAEMNSFNHYAYGAVGEWITSKVGGIELLGCTSGVTKVRIEPHPHPRVSNAESSLQIENGLIEVNWNYKADGEFTISVNLPANTEAELALPKGDSNSRALEILHPGEHLKTTWIDPNPTSISNAKTETI